MSGDRYLSPLRFSERPEVRRKARARNNPARPKNTSISRISTNVADQPSTLAIRGCHKNGLHPSPTIKLHGSI